MQLSKNGGSGGNAMMGSVLAFNAKTRAGKQVMRATLDAHVMKDYAQKCIDMGKDIKVDIRLDNNGKNIDIVKTGLKKSGDVWQATSVGFWAGDEAAEKKEEEVKKPDKEEEDE